MKIYTPYLIWLCLIVLSTCPLLAQDDDDNDNDDESEQSTFVWPGDLNNDGIANSRDLLYWGSAVGSIGEERDDDEQVIFWDALELDDDEMWQEFFPDGINYAFADADGNGIIDEMDILAIENNYDFVHGNPQAQEYPSGVLGIDPPLYLSTDEDTLYAGQVVQLEISLGDVNYPVADFYGLLFSLKYNNAFVQPNSAQFNVLPNSWIDEAGFDNTEFTTSIIKDKPLEGTTDVGLTRVNQNGISGFGTIGIMEIIIVDNVDFLTIDSLNLQLEKAYAVDGLLSEVPVYIDLMKREEPSLPPQTTNVGSQVLEQIAVFPNPVEDQLIVRNLPSKPLRVNGISLTGKLVPLQIINQEREEISIRFPESNQGLMLLELLFEEGILTRKIYIK